MAKYNVRNVIHIENDVLLYYNCDETLTEPLTNSRQIHIPFDSYTRNIASIVYIPDASTLGQVLAHYDYGKNDMYNFSEIRKKTNLIDQFPIFIEDTTLRSASLGSASVLTDALGSASVTDALERAFVSHGWSRFDGYIFDAAAIGQFIGGVENVSAETRPAMRNKGSF